MLPRNLKGYILDKLRCLFKHSGLPKLEYLNGAKVTIYSTEEEGTIQSIHYSPELASYIYWVNINGVVAPIPESYLSQN